MSSKNKNRHKTRIASAPELVSRGVVLLNRGDRNGAENSWRKATELDPHCAPAWRCLTEFLALNKRDAEAISCLQKLIAVSDRTSASLYALADKCSYLKQYAQARTFLRESLTQNPPRELLLDASLLLAKIDYAEKD